MTDHAQILAVHAQQVRRRVGLLAGLGLAIATAFLFDVAHGPSALPLSTVLDVLFDPSAAEGASRVIVWNVRLPAATMAILVGAALALAGAEMQTVLNNPLASPFTLGMSSAAIFGAALAIVLNIGIPGVPTQWIVSANAFLFALGSVFVLQAMARTRDIGPSGLVLFGMALFFTFNALVAILQFVATEQALSQLVFWTMGDLSRSTWEKVRVLTVVVGIVTPLSLMASGSLTALRLGEDRAQSFGVNVARVRFLSLLRVSILTATAVAFVGTVAFVGLVGPHIARLLIGEDHRFFLPASALSGALIMSIASVVSKSILPGGLIPIGLVTALIGVPFFVTLILTRRDRA